jgi:hypothetical protein
MTPESLVIELAARIDEDSQLILSVLEDRGREDLRPSAGIADLLPRAPGGTTSITVEVKDFFQCGTVYDVYGATLADDGHEITAHWEPTGRGRRYQFVVSEAEARRVKFVVGATPRRPGAPVPIPFTSWRTPGGSAPTDIRDPVGPTKSR